MPLTCAIHATDRAASVALCREQSWSDAEAPVEETEYCAEAIHRHFLPGELERPLAGLRTVVDVGGSADVFFSPLAWHNQTAVSSRPHGWSAATHSGWSR